MGLEVDPEKDAYFLRAFNVVAVPEDLGGEVAPEEEGTPTAQEVEQPPAGETNGHVADEEAEDLLGVLAGS